jgi:hypothetical protein
VPIPDRQIGQDLAVDLDASLVETGHEAIIGEAVLASGGVDTGYPEATKLPLAVPAMHIGVVETVHEGFAGPFEETVANTSMAPRLSDNLLVPSLLDDASFDSAQGLSPPELNNTLGASVGEKAPYPPT